MQMQDLVKPLEQMSDEELQERLRQLRHRRTVSKPARADRERRSAKKGTTGRINKVESLLKGLTPEQIQELLGDIDE